MPKLNEFQLKRRQRSKEYSKELLDYLYMNRDNEEDTISINLNDIYFGYKSLDPLFSYIDSYKDIFKEYVTRRDANITMNDRLLFKARGTENGNVLFSILFRDPNGTIHGRELELERDKSLEYLEMLIYNKVDIINKVYNVNVPSYLL